MIYKASKAKQIDFERFIQDGIDIHNRTINIFDEIDSSKASIIISGLQLMVAQNKTLPINIYINSNGGEVYSGFSIYNFIRSLKETHVNTHILGIAASIASIVFLAGDTRYMHEESALMLHSITGGVDGKLFSDIKNEVDEMRRLYNRMCVVYDVNSNKTLEYWKSHLKHEHRYYSPEDALELGFIDSIVKGVENV